MIVCLCRGIGEQTIQRIIDAGAKTADDVSRACGAAGDCGACYDMVAEMVRDGAVCATGSRA